MHLSPLLLLRELCRAGGLQAGALSASFPGCRVGGGLPLSWWLGPCRWVFSISLL